ncbi:DNA cytosine methyltransferase [Tessaracoccus antarcticus]|uniref:DNA (cytosine-5-)-methyltransferase n=1 Tax=Tessaracoccus antarcticus TaxID=2479848 RepID=A0A3M0GCZ0_9ACTN|nr:DNA cytosine methyltransferase [Tessaracoccus antarcticus]
MPVIDVFAGPGGLNEGFASVVVGDEPLFRIAASFEMESNAVETLVLRSTVRALSTQSQLYEPYREFLDGELSMSELRGTSDFKKAEAFARAHVNQIELGRENREKVASRIHAAIDGHSDWVLVGGPPCQAYSLVGRSRRAHDPTFAADHKHFLYKEYLDIIKRFEPPVFVMENVKGLLSANHNGSAMFERIMRDLSDDGKYRIRSLVVDDESPEPADFVIRAEKYNIPQRRHRIILLGVRDGFGTGVWGQLKPAAGEVTVAQALVGLGKVLSGVSRNSDPSAWIKAQNEAFHFLSESSIRNDCKVDSNPKPDEKLERWLTHREVGITLHDPRSHMASDLTRYAYLAGLAEFGEQPKVFELPPKLRPNHRNIDGAKTPFVDRFKVQRWDRPSSTIASHISKDGHYYIHPDPQQMRSLTVREAARLQTFPDDYYFCGPRTAQYHQVGNAVPPLLALQIAEQVAKIFER